MSLHFPASQFETHIRCFQAAEVFNSLVNCENFSCPLVTSGEETSGRLPSSRSKVDKTCMTLCKHAVSCCSLGLNILQWLKISILYSIFHGAVILKGQVVDTTPLADFVVGPFVSPEQTAPRSEGTVQ